MSDFLRSLAARALRQVTVAWPRIGSMFEPDAPSAPWATDGAQGADSWHRPRDERAGNAMEPKPSTAASRPSADGAPPVATRRHGPLPHADPTGYLPFEGAPRSAEISHAKTIAEVDDAAHRGPWSRLQSSPPPLPSVGPRPTQHHALDHSPAPADEFEGPRSGDFPHASDETASALPAQAFVGYPDMTVSSSAVNAARQSESRGIDQKGTAAPTVLTTSSPFGASAHDSTIDEFEPARVALTEREARPGPNTHPTAPTISSKSFDSAPAPAGKSSRSFVNTETGVSREVNRMPAPLGSLCGATQFGGVRATDNSSGQELAPSIHVTIGRIDVSSPAAPTPVRRTAIETPHRQGLQQYLQGRSKGARHE